MFALKTVYMNTLVILQPFLFTFYEIETEYHKKRQSRLYSNDLDV